MQIHKKIIFLIIIFAIFLLYPYCVKAHVDDKINYVEMKIQKKQNGNAIITEFWDVNSMERFSYYKLYKNISKNQIINFSVTDDKETTYECLESWDIYMPNEEKINRCGINYTDEGAELCWGVNGDGFHTYNISYEVENFDEKSYYFIDERIESCSIRYRTYNIIRR